MEHQNESSMSGEERMLVIDGMLIICLIMGNLMIVSLSLEEALALVQKMTSAKRKKSENSSTRQLRPRKTTTIEKVNEEASTSKEGLNEDDDETDDGLENITVIESTTEGEGNIDEPNSAIYCKVTEGAELWTIKKIIGMVPGKTPREDKYVWTFDNFIGGVKHLFGNSMELANAKVLTEEELEALEVVDYDKAQNDALKKTKKYPIGFTCAYCERSFKSMRGCKKHLFGFKGPAVGAQQYLRIDCNVRWAEELEGKFDRKKCPLTTVPDPKKRIWAYIEAIDKSLWITGKDGRLTFNCPDNLRKEYVEGLTK